MAVPLLCHKDVSLTVMIRFSHWNIKALCWLKCGLVLRWFTWYAGKWLPSEYNSSSTYHFISSWHIVIYNQETNSIVMLELTCPLDSTDHLEATRDCKQGKMEYLEIMSEFQRLGVDSHYDTLELSVLGHYLPPSLASLKNCINFIQGVENFSKCDSRRILQSAATISISSSRRIFLARNCTEWSKDTWLMLNLYVTIFVFN